jgi:nitrite reductase/ring-hydroxylating ferredoxin subunit
MPAFLAVKQEKVFMTIPMYKSLLVIFFISLLTFAGCTPDLSDDAIPQVPFDDIVLELTLPANNALKTNTGFKYVSGGVRGIIVYRINEGNYVAFERNCSYHPNDACATVNVDVSGLYMTDPCCSSTFNFPNGDANGGPAIRPLNEYRTNLNGTTLTITDDVVN